MRYQGNCTIGFQHDDGTVVTINCTENGSPDDMLPLLNIIYKTRDMALKLVSLGDIRAVKPIMKPSSGYGHSISNPEPNVIVAYSRDCKPGYQNQTLYVNMEEYNKYGCTSTYNYLFINNSWECYTPVAYKLHRVTMTPEESF